MSNRLLCRVFCLVQAIVLSHVFPVWAGPVTAVPYEATFEDAADNANWQFADVPPNLFQPSNSVLTHWEVGNLTSRYGASSLYVVDKDNNVGYDKGSYLIAAYRTYMLPAGQYNISFDWKAVGNSSDGLYVAWVPANQSIVGMQSGAVIPSYIQLNLINDLRTSEPRSQVITQPMKQNAAFKNVTGSVNVTTGVNYNLVFVWVVNNSSADPMTPGACIDNVQVTRVLTSSDGFELPDNLSYAAVGNNAKFSWTGTADSWDFELYGSQSTDPVAAQSGLTTQEIQMGLTTLPEGIYTFRVRSWGDGEHSRWVEYTNILIYDPAAHCLDYLNFSAPGVTCTYGDYLSEMDDAIFDNVGFIDYGYESIESRHTIHYVPGETDPRTNGMLPTVPPGEIAAVRLGNWDSGGYGQSVTYTIRVTEDVGVLQVKYAVVSQSGGHARPEQPTFYLEILGMNNNQLSPTCGVADFRPPTSGMAEGWHIGSESDIYWREWTTIGINLQDYIGQDVKVRIRTSGCSPTAHWGYGYFTLGCSSGEIIGVTCGEKPRTLAVDPGFKYRWYKPNNPDEPFYAGQDSTAQELYIASNDSNLYACDLISLANEECYFTLRASAMARYPKARATFTHTPEDCINRVSITNNSSIFGYYFIDGREMEVNTMDTCGSYEWSRINDDGSSTVFSTARYPDPLVLPNEGDTFQVQLKVGMVGDITCFGIDTFDVYVPAIGPNEAVTEQYICAGDSVEFEGALYKEPGEYPILLQNVAGCDSLLTLRLNVLQVDTVVEDPDTICDDQVLQWRGVTINGQDFLGDSVFYSSLQSSMLDCDSIVYVKQITVMENLLVALDEIPSEVCADDTAIIISYHVEAGSAKQYDLVFEGEGKVTFGDILNHPITDESVIVLPLRNSSGIQVEPGNYSALLTVYNYNKCGNVQFPIEFGVLYSRHILQQKWNDAIAIKNAQYNGGYDFVSYRWYRNGEPINEYGPYLYLGEGNEFVWGDYYQVGLVCAGKTEEILTCPLYPEPKESGSMQPSLANVGGMWKVSAPNLGTGEALVWSSMGLPLGKWSIQNGEVYIPQPERQGVYIIGVRSFANAEVSVLKAVVD